LAAATVVSSSSATSAAVQPSTSRRIRIDGLGPALTTIRLDLGASGEQLEWTVNAYNRSFTVLLMTASSLGDRFGRRRLFAGGLALSTVRSAACAMAPSVEWLIVARAVRGVGAALVMPLAPALVGGVGRRPPGATLARATSRSRG